jgi:hypothetical protein
LYLLPLGFGVVHHANAWACDLLTIAARENKVADLAACHSEQHISF